MANTCLVEKAQNEIKQKEEGRKEGKRKLKAKEKEKRK